MASSIRALNRSGDNSVYLHRVLDVLVAEVGLQRSRIVPFIGQRKATGVAQHVMMSRKA